MTFSIIHSRTIAFAVVLAVLSVMQGYLNVFELDAHTEMIVGIAISVVVTVLRIITTQPLLHK